MIPSLMLAFFDWRKGLFVTIAVAMLQDPLRKITPGQPTYFIVLVGAVFGALWLGAFLRGTPVNPNRIVGWKRNVGAPLVLFLFLMAVQSVNSYARFDNVMLPAIGMLSYLTPFLALTIGYQFAVRRGTERFLLWLRFYVVCVLVMLVSVYLQYAGFEWKTLGEVGEGVTIYDVGTVLTAHSGFFRASEIAAWHTATAACFLFLIGTEKRLTFWRTTAALLLIGFLAGVGLLTGRRKLLVEISIFLITYFFLIMLLRKNSKKFAVLFFLLGLTLYIGFVGAMSPDPSEQKYQMGRYQMYVERSKGVIEEIPERLNNLGLRPVLWAVNNFGVLGAGLGVGSQGTQHFGGGAQTFGGAAEGGLGKITTELGLPGLFLVIWFTAAMGRYALQILRAVSKRSARVSRLSYGLIAFLVANAAAFSVATQAYGDLFILIFLGLVSGFFMATPVLAERESQEQQKPFMATVGPYQGIRPNPLRLPPAGARDRTRVS
jgi:hypothetical protein